MNEGTGTAMWPKVIAQLFELLPHISRILPMADRFFASKAATEKANEAALAAIAEAVRGDLGQVTKAHAGLYRQLQELDAQTAENREELKRVRLAMEQHDHRLESLNLRTIAIARWIKAGVFVLVAMMAVMMVLLVRSR